MGMDGREEKRFWPLFRKTRQKQERVSSGREAEAKKQQRVTKAIRQLGFIPADVPSLPASGQPSDMNLRFSLPADRIAEPLPAIEKIKLGSHSRKNHRLEKQKE